MADFWHSLEAATNLRQGQMFASLNARMAALGQRIEAAVGSALDVSLEPAQLHLDPPSAADFHANLQDLFAEGMGSSSSAHIFVSLCQG